MLWVFLFIVYRREYGRVGAGRGTVCKMRPGFIATCSWPTRTSKNRPSDVQASPARHVSTRPITMTTAPAAGLFSEGQTTDSIDTNTYRYRTLMCMLNYCLEWDQWVLTNLLTNLSESSLTHLGPIPLSHESTIVAVFHAWLHSRAVTTRMAALARLW